MKWSLTALVAAGLLPQSAEGQAKLFVSTAYPATTVARGYDGPSDLAIVGTIYIGAGNPDGTPAHVKFQVSPADFVEPACAQTLFFSPSSGTTPATVYVGINQRDWNLPVGFCDVYFSTVDQSPVSKSHATVIVKVTPPAVPTVTAILGAADFLPAVSPGDIVSIFGTNLGQNAGALSYDTTGTYPLSLGASAVYTNTTVTFNGMAAPLLYVNPGQINAVVPYGVTGTNAGVVVSRAGQASAPLTIALKDTSPAIFTATQNGSGQGAILNVSTTFPYTYTYNGSGNPAPKGSYIEFFATGVGAWNPSVPDGGINLVATNFTAKALSVTIGGQPAQVYYAGSAPYQPWAMIQLIVLVPSGIGTGPQPLVLTIGNNDNTQQKLTVAIQ
jgi:uncharacterized protein (TIGR03437 family)